MAARDEEDFSNREALEHAGAAIVTAIATGLGTQVQLSPEVQVMVAVVSPIAGIALGRGVHGLLKTRFPTFADWYGKAFGGDPEKVREHAEAHKEDEEYHQRMYRSFRMMLDAADPEVVPVLGYMAGKYDLNGWKTDLYFRGVGRFLCDLEPGELESVRGLLRKVHEHRHEVENVTASLTIDEFGDDGSGRVELNIGGTGRIPLLVVINAARLFNLFRREGLAGGLPVSRGMRRDVGDHVMRLHLETLDRMLMLIDPFPAAQPV